MFYECHNCGMMPDACVCIPWCFKHNRQDWNPRCRECEIELTDKRASRLKFKAERLARWTARWREFYSLFGW